MSLPRVSYLESWESNPASFRRQQDRDQSPVRAPYNDDDEESYNDLPDTSVASSFPSVTDLPSLRQRLNFNPISGLGWNQATRDGADHDLNSLSRVSSLVSKHGHANHSVEGEEAAESAELEQDNWGPLETTGAFEVGGVKRACRLNFLLPTCYSVN